MKITFYGAAREVTGSKHLLEVNGKKILLDCGMAQGRREESDEQNRNFPIDAKAVDAMILSHAHIDHSGLIPLLIKNGFKGKIFSTAATRDVANYMLADSAFIQEREYEYLCKKKKKCTLPLYTTEDATNAMQHFVGMPYEEAFTVTDGVVASFYDAGHILGSALTHLLINDQETGEQIAIGFTGDLGRKNLPLLRDPQIMPPVDFYITEATYGNRLHAAFSDMEVQMAEIIKKTATRGGKIIIPAFALERAQEIIYMLHKLTDAHKIPELPIFVDSPLAVNVTDVFMNHPECLDKNTYKEFLNNRDNPFGFGRLKYTHSAEESKKLNELNGPAIIIAASGMCEHGRILHHLKNNIENPKTTVLLVGYQAANTLGRKLQDGQKSVNIFGDPYRVNADIINMDGFSAHADRSDLIDYIERVNKQKTIKKIFIVHSEEQQATDFQQILKNAGYQDVIVPHMGETFELKK